MRRLQTDVSRRPVMPRNGRYAVRPFYLTILVFTVIVAASWLLGPFEDGPIARSSPLGRRQWDGVDALKRMPEVKAPVTPR